MAIRGRSVPRWAVVVALACSAGSAVVLGVEAWREGDLRAVLERVASARERVSFSATVRWAGRFRGETYRAELAIDHWHDAPAGPRTQLARLISLEVPADAPPELRRAIEGWALRAGVTSGWRTPTLDPARLSRNYHLRLRDGGDWHGRASWELAIAPRRPGRPALALRVDRETGLPLSLSLYHAGQLSLAVELLELRPGRPAGEPTPPRRSSRPEVSLDEARARDPGLRLPARLPDGFSLESIHVHELPGGRAAVRAQYGDGLARLFLVQVEGDPPERKEPRNRSGSAFESRLSRTVVRGGLDIELEESPGRASARLRLDRRRLLLAGDAPGEELADCLASSVQAP